MKESFPIAQVRESKPASYKEVADSICYFEGNYIPIADAKVSIGTHALQYGTGCFEGVRAYYSPEDTQLYVLALAAHAQRLVRSSSLLKMQLGKSPRDIEAIILEVLRRSGFRQDVYIRPVAYKASVVIKVGLTGLRDELAVYATPMGDYVSTQGLSVQISGWRRTSDNAIPARSKLTGSYLNAALAVDDALQAGFDDAILLTDDGHVSEGSSSNLFLVRDGVASTPGVTHDILEGITRKVVMRLLLDMGIPTVERSVDRTELYIADEVILCGTGVQVAPVVEIDRRPIGGGATGPVAAKLQKVYFDACRGRDPRYRDLVTPV